MKIRWEGRRYGPPSRLILSACPSFAPLGWLRMKNGPLAPMKPEPLPSIVEKDGRHALMVNGAPFLMLGAQINNSSAWPPCCPRSGRPSNISTRIRWRCRSIGSSSSRSRGDSTTLFSIRFWPRRATTGCTWCCSGSAPGRTAAPLHARMGQAIAPAFSPDDRARRATAGFTFAVRTGRPRGGLASFRRAHVAFEDRRFRAHGLAGSSRERAGHLGERARLLAGSEKLFTHRSPPSYSRRCASKSTDRRAGATRSATTRTSFFMRGR